MNSRLSNKIIAQIIRRNPCRSLSVKQNINRSSGSHYAFNFHLKNEKHFSCFSLSRQYCKKTLNHAQASSYTSFQRNASTALPDALKTLEMPIVEEPQVGSIQMQNTMSYEPDLIDVMSESNLVNTATDVLLYIHEVTGLPWWASIALTAFLARTCITLPFSINQVRLLATKEVVDEEMKGITKNLEVQSQQAMKVFGWPKELVVDKYEKALNTAREKVSQREGYHAIKCFSLFIIQTPLWVSFTLATRKLCLPPPDVTSAAGTAYKELLNGGFGWVQDLTQTDPYFVLPIAIAMTNILIIEVYQLFSTNTESPAEQGKLLFFQMIALCTLPISVLFPAASNIYMLSSSTFGILHAFIINTAPARRIFKIPAAIPAQEEPYKFFLQNLKVKMGMKAIEPGKEIEGTEIESGKKEEIKLLPRMK